MQPSHEELDRTAIRFAEILLSAAPETTDLKNISSQSAKLAYSWHSNKKMRQSYYRSQNPCWITINEVNTIEEDPDLEAFRMLSEELPGSRLSDLLDSLVQGEYYWIVTKQTREVEYAEYFDTIEEEDGIFYPLFRIQEKDNIERVASHFIPHDQNIDPSTTPIKPSNL